ISGAPKKASNIHIREHALLDIYYVCAMHANHALASKPLTLESFAAADHLMVTFSGDANGPVDEFLRAQGLDRRVAMTVNHFSLVAPLLKESDLISTMPFEAVAEYACKGELWVDRPPIELPPITLSLFWHERGDRDAGQRWLRNQIKTIMAEARRAHPMPTWVYPDQQRPGFAEEQEPATDFAFAS